MALETLPPEDQPLAQAAADFFVEHFEKPKIRYLEAIDPELRWRPHIHFKTHSGIVAADISQEPFPGNLHARAMDLVHQKPDLPVAIYSVCPLQAMQRLQADVVRLQEHGFGLLTIDMADGNRVHRVFSCIPYIQHIPRAELVADIRDLNKELRLRFRGAYDIYTGGKAASGVQEARQIIEDLVNGTIKQAIKKGWSPPGVAVPSENKAMKLPAAKKLDFLAELQQFRKVKPDLMLASHFLRDYGNPSSHPGKNRQEAVARMAKVKMGFKTSINVAIKLADAIKTAGLSVKLLSA